MNTSNALRLLLFTATLALLSALGVAQTVRAPKPAPSEPYVLRAVVPMEGDYAGPIRLEGLPTESSVIGRNRAQTFHLVAALVIGKAGPWKVLREESPAPRVRVPDVLVESGQAPGRISIEIDGKPFSLTGGGMRVEHFGRLFMQGRRTLDMGELGDAQVWIQASAGTTQLDFVVNWHAGEDRQGDVLFTSVKLLIPKSTSWQPLTADPAMVVADNLLVKPVTGGGKHILPQRAERSFRFSVYTAGTRCRPPQFGVADTLYGWTLPAVSLTQTDVDGYRDQLRRVVASSDFTGGTPTSFLWPAMGSEYGGVTGGIDMNPYPGVAWFVSASAFGFERYVIEQLRYRSRHWGCLYEKNGEPVRWWERPADWRMFDSVWQTQGAEVLDGPFGPWPARRFAEAAYRPQSTSATDNFYKSIDGQHGVREWNHNALLVALTCDPLALHYLKMEAAKNVMTFYPWPGRANRMHQPFPNGGGTGFGRAEAWALMEVSRAITFGAAPERYAPWVKAWVDHLAAAQSTSGLFQLNPGAKEGKQWPFGAPDGSQRYVIGASNEEIYIAAALREASLVVDVPPEISTKHTAGMLALSWAEGRGVPWSHTARRAAPDGPIYTSRADWPEELRTALRSSPSAEGFGPYPEGWHVGYWLACSRSVEALKLHAGKPDVAQALAAIRARAPRDIDQWWPVLGVPWPTSP